MLADQISKEIDALRGFAVLSVLWGHSMYSLNMPVELNGAFGVWIFFSLSGFFIGKSFFCGHYGLSAESYFSFLWNRSLRILPLYYTALCAGLIFELIMIPDEIIVSAVIRQFLFISPLNSITLSGPLWALAVSAKFYVISIFFIWIIVKVNREKRITLLLFLLALSCIISWLYIKACGDIYIQPRTLLGNLHFFMWGILLAVVNWERLPAVSSVNKFGAIFILIVIAWYLNNWKPAYFWGLSSGLSGRLALGYGALCGLLITFVVMLREVRSDNGVGFKIGILLLNLFGWCGFYSYAIYVCHAILGKANQIFFHISPGPLYLFYLLLSIPLAYLSYKFIEAPLHELRAGKMASHFFKK